MGRRRDAQLPSLAASPVATRPMHVLVVDDNEQIRESTQILLEACGFHVSVAADGKAGVAQALALHPDAAVVDVGLPGLNGLEVASRIRAVLGPDIFLVAVTGYSQLGDRESTVAAGFDVHLVKPVRPQDQVRVLNEGRAAGSNGEAK